MQAVLRTSLRRTVQKSTRTGARQASGGVPLKEPGGMPLPGSANQPDMWSGAYWLTCAVGLVFGTVGLAGRQDTSIKTWARYEALARKDAGADGEAELGQSYLDSSTSYSKEGVGIRPTVAE